jgi:hypothetical protein
MDTLDDEDRTKSTCLTKTDKTNSKLSKERIGILSYHS